MIKRRCSPLLGISSNTILRCFMAGATDLIRTLSSSSSLPNPYYSNLSRIRTCSNQRFFVNGCSSENYANTNVVLRHNAVQNLLLRAAYAPPFIPPHQEVFSAEGDRSSNILDPRIFNGDGAAGDVHNRWKKNNTGAEDKSLPEKVMVAVDVDEVLGNFVSALNKFIADRYSLNHSVSEYHVYEFFKIWNCSRIEADLRVHEFFKSHYFKKGIYPIPGAQKALQSLSNICNLSIVTSRQNAIKDHTINWIEEHYPGLFQEIHFGNHFALDGKSRPKSDICKSLEAKVLIDDNPKYAIECAEVGIKVLLFDYENSYPWSKTDYISHPLITKVHNWEEVEHHLASWIVS